MSNELNTIYTKITHTRTILHALLNYNSPTDYIVLNCSWRLDKLLNKYEQVRTKLLNNGHQEAI